ncbi:mtDNA inheritance, partitioning of the mitochondrial organelle [Mortierella sp. AD031]|nr:mtDNA inheritance, partitioning of the mitochondrial organelle [Mortierella sp. AD031]KAG0216181.1 mtDNA inheritance, partitioning of the mitochondrial organelle [Mortierella sp. NVP41]
MTPEPTAPVEAPAATTTPAAGSNNARAAATAPGLIDREKLCPFLLKMFYKKSEHHRVDTYTPESTPGKSTELQLYTWKNATMGEIASLVKQAIPDLIEQVGPSGELRFRHIYLDVNRGIYVGRDIGKVLLADTFTETDVTVAEESGAEEKKDEAETVATEGEGAEISLEQGLFTRDIRKSIEDNTATTTTTTTTTTPAAATARTTTATATNPTWAGSPRGFSTAIDKTLGSIRFVIGDYLDIAIQSFTTPGFVPPNVGNPGSNAPPSRIPGVGGGGRSLASGGGGGGGGPIRRRDGRGRRGEGRHGGGGSGGGGGALTDRFAGRLGGRLDPLDRNGHGGRNGGGGGRRGPLDVEGSWKGRGRGR